MSTFFNKKTALTALVLTAAVSGSFLAAQTGGTTPPPASMPAADKPIATIVGRDINNAAFYSLLMQVAGMRVFQQVFDLTLVQGDCVRNDIPVTALPVDKDGKATTPEGKDFQERLDAELKRTKDSLVPAGTSEEDKNKILNETLGRQGITGIEFSMGLERQSGLRALAKKIGGLKPPTDEQINDAWNSEYGEKMIVRVYPMPSVDAAANFRAAIEKDKKTPEAAQQSLKLPAPASWTISKNAKGNGIEKLAEVAFTKKPGELTGSLEFNGQLIVMFIDRHEDSTLVQNPLSQMRAKVTADLVNYNETVWMNTRLAKLRMEAQNNFSINDPVLKMQFQALYEAQMRAATQSAPAPGPDAAAPALPPASMPAPATRGR